MRATTVEIEFVSLVTWQGNHGNFMQNTIVIHFIYDGNMQERLHLKF